MRKIVYLVCSTLFIQSCGSSQQNSTATSKSTTTKTEIIDPTVYGNTITSAELKEMLYIYASDEFEGRETGQPGQKKAVNYLKEQYISMGIGSPLSKNDYFQKVPLEKQKTPEIEFLVNGKSFAMFDNFVSIGSIDTQSFSTSKIVYVGYGIDSENYSDYNNINVKGKIVLIKAGEPKNEDGTYITSGTTEETKWSKGRGARSSKRDVAKAKGAKALIIMDDKAFPVYSNAYSRLAKSGTGGKIALKSKTKNMLLFLVNSTFAKTLYSDIESNDMAQTVKTSIDLTVKNNYEALDSENVVAFIKGSEKPDEIIVISAHLDHEGIKNGKVYNGADDDGSGTIAVIEIAEAFKTAVNNGHSPKRSILFLHVTGEEKGLLGSRHYTDNDPIFPLENTVANLNIDMIGRVDKNHEADRNFVYLIGADKLSTELHDLSEAVNTKHTNINLDYTYNDENDPNRYYYRSDHYNFAKNNVPVIFYFNGTHADYHKPTDTPEKIEYDLLENRTRLVFYTAWELVNRDNRIIVDKKS